MSYNPEKALIIQSGQASAWHFVVCLQQALRDRTILLEVHSPRAEEAREAVRLPPGTS